MGAELDITQELASVCVALTETNAIAGIIHGEIRNNEFLARFDSILNSIAGCVDVVTVNLNPFLEISSEAMLLEKFDALRAVYTESYLKEISKPRIYSDEAYEEYVLLRLMKETKTGFPILKRTFERLDKYIDKWITNDAWLAMSIDNMFKRLQTLFNEIATVKTRDSEDAFSIHSRAFADFRDYLDMIRHKHARLLTEIQPRRISRVN